MCTAHFQYKYLLQTYYEIDVYIVKTQYLIGIVLDSTETNTAHPVLQNYFLF